jgi:regulatory protein
MSKKNKNQDAEIKKAENYVLNLISFRPRSCYEVELKMRKKRFSEDVIKKTINKALKLGYLNDEKFAKIWVNNKVEGKIKIQKELRQKGIADEIIEEILKDIDDEIEIKKAFDLGKKRMERLKNEKPFNRVKRCALFLERKGFSYEVIKKVLAQLTSSDFIEEVV